MAFILGINISNLKEPELLKRLDDFLHDNRQHYLVTPNPEILLAANKDEELFFIMSRADVALADGFGLQLAGLLSGHSLPRITGADITLKLLAKAEQEKIRVTILNWNQGLSKAAQIEAALSKRFPKLNFLILDIDRDSNLNSDVIEKINNFSPEVLFSALGSPYQEKIIYHNLSHLPSVRLALGVGGSFDFITGSIKRAPKILRKIGLEWLWRLWQQPKRYKRIYNATCVFMAKFIQRSLINRWRYRPNVVCLLYKNTQFGRLILVAKREDNGGWQLPQGGRDGQNIEKAARREIEEELGLKKNIKTKGLFKNVYRYLFKPESGALVYPSGQKYLYRGYKGQKQSLFIGEYLGRDEDVKINFWDHSAWQWLPENELLEKVEPVRQKATAIFLKKLKSLPR